MAIRRMDLLFLVVAVQNGFITHRRLVEVTEALESGRGSAADLLSESGELESGQVAAIEQMVEAAPLEMASAKSQATDETLLPISVAELLPQPAESRVSPDARYELRSELGRGGLGRVVLALDRDLKREVALKFTLATDEVGSTNQTEDRSRRLVDEARITGQLEHPNVVPVYELGRTGEGRPFYGMRLLRGRSLRRQIDSVFDEWSELDSIERGRVRIRLLQTFLAVCNAVAYAHSRGVIHRDLKPDNIMVGDFGETLVIDWGLAKVVGQGDEAQDSSQGPTSVSWKDRKLLERIRTAREAADFRTREGAIMGTPRYAAPEQLLGRIGMVDERSDIYSLGAVLYEVLTLRSPFEGDTIMDVANQAVSRGPIRPRQRAPEMEVPEELEAVVVKAMKIDPGERFRTADELRTAIEEFLEGTRRREAAQREARRLLEEGQRLSARWLEASAAASTAEAGAARLRRGIEPWQPVEAKRPLWESERAVHDLRTEAAQAFSAATGAFTAALSYAPDLAEARLGLCDLLWQRLETAEIHRDEEEVVYFRSLIERFDTGLFAERLRGDGWVQVSSDPEGAEVFLFRYCEHDRKLLPVPVVTGAALPLGRELGTTDPDRPPEALCSELNRLGVAPTGFIPLAMGSYACVLRHPDRASVRLPLLVERGARVSARARLPEPTEIEAAFAYIPAGPFLVGGDPDAVAAGPRRVVDLPGFFISRHPVTCREYLEFLHHLSERDPDEAHRRCPRSAPDGGQYWPRSADGRHAIPTATWVETGGGGRRLQAVPEWWEEDWPVVGVSWEDAMAYCRYASERLGRPATLPRELEWEKAARGVDGRFYPWGNDFDATYCNGNSSHRDGMRPVVVGAFPVDESPYGVRGMAGNAADWCLDSPGADERETLSQHEQWRLMRGAGWASMDAFHRLASRGAYVMTLVLDHLGFRLCLPEQ